jgi:hypothetical protein
VALAGVADRVTLAEPDLLAGLLGGHAGGNGNRDGDGPGHGDVDAAAGAIADRLEPGTDVHASREYRRRLARVLVARALRQACARATGAAP